MKKFVYPYDKILSIKTFERKEKEAKFAAIAFEINRLKNEINKKRDFLLSAKKDSSKNRVYWRKYFDRIAKEIDLLQHEIDGLKDEFNKRKEEYIKAKQQEEIYKKLKERMFEKFKQEYYQEEMKVLDEAGQNLFFRRN
jgi:flagellar export protein FliJ